MPANRWPPRWVHSHTSSGSARARVATIGRPRTAQHASRVPWVHTSTIGSASSSLALSRVPRAWAAASRSSGVRHVPRTHVRRTVSTAYQRRGSSPGAATAGPPHEQYPAPERAAQAFDLGTDRTEQRLGVHRLLGPGPLVLDEQPARRDRGGAGLRVTAVQRRGGAAREIGQGHPAMLCGAALAARTGPRGGQARPCAARLRRLTLSMMTARRSTAPVTMNLTLDSTLSRSSPLEMDWMTRMPSSAE